MIELYNIDRARDLRDRLETLQRFKNALKPGSIVEIQDVDHNRAFIEASIMTTAIETQIAEIAAKLTMIGVNV